MKAAPRSLLPPLQPGAEDLYHVFGLSPRDVAGHPLDTKHPAIRETLRGIGRKHGSPSRRAAAITTAEVRKL